MAEDRYTAGRTVNAQGSHYGVYRVLPGQSHTLFPAVIENMSKDEATYLWLLLGQELGREEAFTDEAREEIIQLQASETWRTQLG